MEQTLEQAQQEIKDLKAKIGEAFESLKKVRLEQPGKLEEFASFPKISRLNRDIIITEKIDGTNAQVHISEDGKVRAGSRNRWVTSENDNHGWAAWVKEHEEELRAGLGYGTHYGEWWGAGIQKGRYPGLQEKYFSLFNVSRWTDDVRPKCCLVVPTLAIGTFSQKLIDDAVNKLRTEGSVAAPGTFKPEGIVIYHCHSGQLFKVTLENDGKHKGET